MSSCQNVKNFFQYGGKPNNIAFGPRVLETSSLDIDNESFRYLGTDKCSLSDYMKFMGAEGWKLSKNGKSTLTLYAGLRNLGLSQQKDRKVESFSASIYGRDVNQDHCEMRVSYLRKKKTKVYTYCHLFRRKPRGFLLQFKFVENRLYSKKTNTSSLKFPLPPNINPHKDPKIEYNDRTRFVRMTFFK